MDSNPTPYEVEPLLWSAVVNGQYVRLVSSDTGSAWRCDCYEFAQPNSNRPSACEHVQFGFDVWFGRKPRPGVIVTDVHEYSHRR